MKKILPDGNGSITIAEVPQPQLFENSVLCRMTHSLISSGTEKSLITNSKGKSVEEIVKAGTQLGYLGAGIVEETKGTEVKDFQKGQKVVFYGGPWVSHSEFVVVPQKLIFPLPENVPPEEGTFMGLGAIALHGFRKGNTGLGEVSWIAGAGLIGNLCAQLALLAGCRVVVSDFETSRLKTLQNCITNKDDCICVSPEEAISTLQKVSKNQGADSIFLCMGTSSSEPMEQAIEAIRSGGKIVILGVLDIQIPRESFFQKEAEITISKAAGPGRYSQDYEKSGFDYPPQFARWTEGRNLEATLSLIEKNKLNVKPLISQVVPLNDAKSLYGKLMQGKSEIGCLIKWD